MKGVGLSALQSSAIFLSIHITLFIYIYILITIIIYIRFGVFAVSDNLWFSRAEP